MSKVLHVGTGKARVESAGVISARPLTKDDLVKLCEPRKVTHIQRLRDSHHRLAMLFAAGHDIKTVAEMVGYSYVRVHRIRNSPAFDELVSGYRRDVLAAAIETFDVFGQAATANMTRAELMLGDQLEQAEESGDLIPIRDLVNIVADRADRFGYPKRGVNINANVDFGARLEQALRRSSRASASPSSPAELSAQGGVIDSSPSDTPQLSEAAE